MDKDIVPELLRNIQKDFDKEKENSELVQQLLQILEEGQANYLNANAYAVEIGELLSKVLNKNIIAETLPDGKMYFNIADRVLNTTLKHNHKLITDYSMEVQSQLNKNKKIGITVKKPPINQDRIDSLVNKLVSKDDFELVKFVLKEPIVNFSQSIVDNTIEVNVDFHAKAGMSPKILRTAVGKACEWCRSLDGIHDYHSLKNEDVFHRHDNCRCTVNYFPGKGKKQDVWTKQERKIANNVAQLKKQQIEDIKAHNRKADSSEYKKMIEVLGKDNMPVSVAKFQEMKYNEIERYEQLRDKMFIQNKFNNGEWLDKINPEKQAKHFKSSAVDGKSYFYDEVDVENLYDKYKQTSKFRRNRKGQNEENYELIDLPDNLKLGKDFYTGEYINGFTIHYSKTGSHIIPTYHRKEDSDET
ncbi:polymorphic toxin type 50 domain-containing protein [Enterococcus cecorum]|uniref:polymorphic toxin type 50 domain-containing protein n=1 Tax=Enterococcus cecorum TaxID=44008 RepID=UPI001FABDF4C|nr:polymorphic toxin type 50 domain-containing protein [Enterococcus cecorum]MCJ0567124.1 polymorphic toxin type 50 domain-containing protein [Enterococcus cecorum]MCJ0597008.1 polymorphic toxin type 50 domain-containing protein [Enterococcus cecorum]